MARSARVLGATSAPTSRTTREWAVPAAAVASPICRDTGTDSANGESNLSMGVVWKANIMTNTIRQSPILLLQLSIPLAQLGHGGAQLVQLAPSTNPRSPFPSFYRTCTQGVVVLARSTGQLQGGWVGRLAAAAAASDGPAPLGLEEGGVFFGGCVCCCGGSTIDKTTVLLIPINNGRTVILIISSSIHRCSSTHISLHRQHTIIVPKLCNFRIAA
ncbi:hypothetical protein PRIPAC_74278, partial [Pristionchus pacificus]|uniref:Uncharacterized protein n=1 Tax=Pristionchus pacificus TaxID=54126 RepID=A0A2A6BFH3_PRIPA